MPDRLTVREVVRIPGHWLMIRAFLAVGMIIIGIGNLRHRLREHAKTKAALR